MQHDLKILPKYFKAVKAGKKKFELRKNDRDYKVGDEIHLEEWEPIGEYTGRDIVKEITYVLKNCEEFGLKNGYCIIGWR
mgnify:FL=1